MRLEETILKSLIHNEEYARKVLPFMKDEYFSEKTDKIIFSNAVDFYAKYNTAPTHESIVIDTEKLNITQEEVTEIGETLKRISEDTEQNDTQWLLDKTEWFCRKKAIENSIGECIQILGGHNKEKTEHAMPEILQEAIAVSFDNSVGHDYIEDSDERFDFYHKVETRVPFDLSHFNSISNGGTPNKTLNIVMAGTGVGKSMFMCHHAANCLSQGNNVLYITCEMAEERIAERIDANLMDITLDDLKDLPKNVYKKKMDRLQKDIKSKLIVKEYPTAVANVTHFRNLLDELKLKRKFVPDIIFVDYLNICASSRMKMGSSINSYTYIKAIAEELRGLAVERNVPLWSATQVNRTGFTSTDIGLEDTSESFGLPATADFMFALIATEELDELGQVLVKQLKNRYNDLASNRKFVVGVNRAKMKFFDLEDSAQAGLVGTGAGYNGKNFDQDFTVDKKFNEDKFTDWKI